MKKLRRKNFKTMLTGSNDCNWDLASLVNNIGTSNDHGGINYLLQIIQLTFDGILASEEKDLNQEREFLDWLMNMGTIHVGNFYRDKLDISRMAGEITERANDILKYNSGKHSKRSHLENEEHEIYESIFSSQKLQQGGYFKIPDTIIPIASEGFEPAFLLASIYDNAKIFPVRYSHISKNDKEVKVPNCLGRVDVAKKIEGNIVRVVEGTVCNGISLNEVCGWVKQKKPSRLEFSCVFGEFVNDGINYNVSTTYVGDNCTNDRFGYFK